MIKRNPDLSWLGAEALPGDLAEIIRVHRASDRAGGSVRRTDLRPQRRGWLATAMRWIHRQSHSGY